jgi:GTPase SAR1 family protein
MQSKLEDVLREKEGELKLYQRFLNLRSFCQERVFPSTDIPLERHIEAVKDLTEQLIPEPLTRTQEMFSGEIFVMLCLLYLHDVGVATAYDWNGNNEIFDRIDKSTKTLIINRSIAERLDIPESAIELVNSLIFRTTIKRVPTQWEIREESRRAIIRNTSALESVFSFAHLLWDIFSPDSGNLSLRRFRHPNLRLPCGVSTVVADSREGVLFIKCLPEIPYQAHLLEMVKGYVEAAFKKFKNVLNGKLGFQYRTIVWEIGDASPERLCVAPHPEPSVFYSARDVPDRWEEANGVLDTLFKNGHVILTGSAGCGKTTLMECFLLPQLRKISPSVFRSEIWERPVGELREAVAAATDDKDMSFDMVSVCSKLRQAGPCFFILDCCERLQNVEEGEREKLKRFVDFCLEGDGLYLILIGDKEDFFDWRQPFSRISLSAISELRSDEKRGSLFASVGESQELLRETIDGILKRSGNKSELREVVAALAGGAPNIARCTLADIRSETGLPLIRIIDYLNELKGKGIVGEHRSFDSTYYSLKSRHLIEHLREYLKLSELDEKRGIRASIARTRKEGVWLPPETLDALEQWSGRLIFEGEDLAFVLASAIYHGRSPYDLQTKFDKDMRGLNMRGDPIVALLKEQDVEKRKAAVRLLSRIRDDQIVNELLLHLRREEDYAVKGLIVETLVGMGKKKTLVALMRTLSEVDDRQWKLQSIAILATADPSTARDALLILAETEKDPEILDAIEKVFSTLEESL